MKRKTKIKDVGEATITVDVLRGDGGSGLWWLGVS